MDLNEVIAQEIEGVKLRLQRYCNPAERVDVLIRIVRSPLEPLIDAEWDMILSAEDWKPNHRTALECIHERGFYNVRSRAIDGYWLGEYITINNHLKKHGLPYRIKANGGINRMVRV